MTVDAARLEEVQSTRWRNQWAELKAQVIDTDLCTGCAGCVISCPHDVIGYEHDQGGYRPFHLEDELGPSDCSHGQKGCTTCTRACPRFGIWEAQADDHLFGRLREPDEVAGIHQDILLTRASDDHVHELGQDGGLVSAILIWALEHDYIDAALVSYLEGDATSWKAVPGVDSGAAVEVTGATVVAGMMVDGANGAPGEIGRAHV
jgi:coenzyme F420 hydrogenase subunit beta